MRALARSRRYGWRDKHRGGGRRLKRHRDPAIKEALGELLDTPTGTIKSRLRKARQLLDEAMKRQAESPELLRSTVLGATTMHGVAARGARPGRCR